MNTQPATKRFLATLTAEGYASPRSSFVVPSLDGSLWFVDPRTGNRHDSAYVVYIGRSITADDVLRYVGGTLQDPERSRRLMDSLIAELQRFTIGNVVAIERSDGERLGLRLVARAEIQARTLTARLRPNPTLAVKVKRDIANEEKTASISVYCRWGSAVRELQHREHSELQAFCHEGRALLSRKAEHVRPRSGVRWKQGMKSL